MQRLFVALDLPPQAREALATLGATADHEIWRPVHPDSLHITLAFLGSRPPEDVDTIAPIIAAEVGTPAPQLKLHQILLLPPRRARVLTVELAHEHLAPLQARISAALEQAAVYTPETRPFRAHVTVARLRPRIRPPRDSGLTIEQLAFEGTAVTLYASRLHPKGARYEPLVTAPLGAT